MTPRVLVVYTYSGCGTCRKAVRWLRERGIQFQEKPIRETPPSRRELRAMLARQNDEVRRLFNTSGQDYRAMALKHKLPSMTRSDALALLESDGKLVRRPFALGPDIGLIGFKENEWEQALADATYTKRKP